DHRADGGTLREFAGRNCGGPGGADRAHSADGRGGEAAGIGGMEQHGNGVSAGAVRAGVVRGAGGGEAGGAGSDLWGETSHVRRTQYASEPIGASAEAGGREAGD